MARSKYIYLIRCFENNDRIVAGFTVKREAIEWALINGYGPYNAILSRLRDGLLGNKEETIIYWPN